MGLQSEEGLREPGTKPTRLARLERLIVGIQQRGHQLQHRLQEGLHRVLVRVLQHGRHLWRA